VIPKKIGAPNTEGRQKIILKKRAGLNPKGEPIKEASLRGEKKEEGSCLKLLLLDGKRQLRRRVPVTGTRTRIKLEGKKQRLERLYGLI